MASTTDNFNLDLYDTGDPAALTDQYNSAMHTIDETLLTINGNASTAVQNTTEIKGWLNNLGITNDDTATDLKNTIETTKTTANNANTQATTNKNNLNALGITDTSTAEASKTRWNGAVTQAATNKTDIAAIEANLNALGAGTTGNATNLKNQIDKSTQILSVNQPFMSRGTNIIVTFGDSYAATTNTRSWAYMLNQRLAWTLHNYAVGGAGYIPPNTTYASEFQTAKNDKTYNHEDVSLVIIGGSRNSNDGYQNTIYQAALTLFQNCVQEYPNARIIAIPLLWNDNDMSGYWRYNAAEIERAAIETGIESIPWAWTWNYGNTANFDSGDIHPNEKGTNIIVSYIIRYLLGTYTGRHEAWTYRPESNPAEFCLTINASGGTISYGMQAQSGLTPANYTSVAGVPAWAVADKDITNSGQRWTTAISNGAQNAVLFHIDNNGHFGWQGFTINPTATPNGLAGVQFTCAW